MLPQTEPVISARPIRREDFSDFDTMRFWSKVRIGAPHECWDWCAAEHGGYGQFRRPNGRLAWAHRVAFALAHGETPSDRNLLHSCDNPACVNPSHLRPGTQAENVADMLAKGRGRSKNIGVNNPCSKLTEAAVIDIATNPASGAEMARRYGCHVVTVSLIRRGIQWSSVTGIKRR